MPSAACNLKDHADIFFLIDDSTNISSFDFNDMKKFIISFLNSFNIGQEKVRMGLVKYSDSPTLEFDLMTHSDTRKLERAVERVTQKGGRTFTGKALSFMLPYFQRAKAPKYLIVITDSGSDDDVRIPAEELRNIGVSIYGIGVKESKLSELQAMTANNKQIFYVHNFDALMFIRDSLLTDICASASKERLINHTH